MSNTEGTRREPGWYLRDDGLNAYWDGARWSGFEKSKRPRQSTPAGFKLKSDSNIFDHAASLMVIIFGLFAAGLSVLAISAGETQLGVVGLLIVAVWMASHFL